MANAGKPIGGCSKRTTNTEQTLGKHRAEKWQRRGKSMANHCKNTKKQSNTRRAENWQLDGKFVANHGKRTNAQS